MSKTGMALLSLLLVMGCDKLFKKEPPARPAGEIWAERVAQVQSGTTRTEVEKLLPVYAKSPTKRTVKDKSQEVMYWLDDEWKVTIEYDFTGVPPAGAGKTEYDHPQNKVLTPPKLERRFL